LPSVVTLTGTVDLYATREAAEDQAGRIRSVVAIQNKIRVVTPAIQDDKLRANVEESITGSFYRRSRHLPNISHFLSIDVHNGVVSLGGYVTSPQMGHDLFEAVARTRGVREIVNRIQLRPLPTQWLILHGLAPPLILVPVLPLTVHGKAIAKG